MAASPTTVETCARATCMLHNYLQVMTLRRNTTSGGFRCSGEVRDGLRGVARMGANNAIWEALRVRALFTSYFNQEGAVPWVQP